MSFQRRLSFTGMLPVHVRHAAFPNLAKPRSLKNVAQLLVPVVHPTQRRQLSSCGTFEAHSSGLEFDGMGVAEWEYSVSSASAEECAPVVLSKSTHTARYLSGFDPKRHPETSKFVDHVFAPRSAAPARVGGSFHLRAQPAADEEDITMAPAVEKPHLKSQAAFAGQNAASTDPVFKSHHITFHALLTHVVSGDGVVEQVDAEDACTVALPDGRHADDLLCSPQFLARGSTRELPEGLQSAAAALAGTGP